MTNTEAITGYLRRSSNILGEVLAVHFTLGFDDAGEPWISHSKMTTGQDYAITRLMEKWVSQEKARDQTVRVIISDSDEEDGT